MGRVFWLFLVCSFKCFKTKMHRGLSQLFRGLQSFLYAFVGGASSVIDLILSQSYAKSQNDQYTQASHIDTLRVLSHIPSLCHAFLLFITHSSPSSFILSLHHTFLPFVTHSFPFLRYMGKVPGMNSYECLHGTV